MKTLESHETHTMNGNPDKYIPDQSFNLEFMKNYKAVISWLKVKVLFSWIEQLL